MSKSASKNVLNERKSMAMDSDEEAESDDKKRNNLQSLVIAWNDCEIADYFHSCFKKNMVLEYSVEMAPETEAPIKSILYYQDSSWMQCDRMEMLGHSFEKPIVRKGSNASFMTRKYSISFDGLEPGKTYSFMFSTEINGMTITQMLRTFECSSG